MDIFGLALLAGLGLLGMVLVIVLIDEISKQGRRGVAARKAQPRLMPPRPKGAEPPPWALKQVTELTHDAEIAERLLMTCWGRNPDRSWDWVHERVVSDLLRDRGYTGQIPDHYRGRLAAVPQKCSQQWQSDVMQILGCIALLMYVGRVVYLVMLNN